jgi:hypothetical protein
MPVYFFNSMGDVQDVWYRSVMETGLQTIDVNTSWYPAGQYTVVLENSDGARLDAATFTKQ